MTFVKKMFGEVGQFIGALWGTVKELAGSRKAVLSFLAIAVPVAAQLLPQYAEQINRIAPLTDGVLVLLVALIGLIDGISASKGGVG